MLYRIVIVTLCLMMVMSIDAFADDKTLQEKALVAFHTYCYSTNADFDYIERLIKPLGFKEMPEKYVKALSPDSSSKNKVYQVGKFVDKKGIYLGFGEPANCSVNIQGADFLELKKMMIKEFQLLHVVTDDVGLQVNEMYVPGGTSGSGQEAAELGVIMMMYPKPSFDPSTGTISFMPPKQARVALGFHAETFEDAYASYRIGDYEAAYESFSKLAASGDVRATYNLGHMCFDGKGVERSLPKALKYFQSAADQGFAQAQSDLGLMYLKGMGVKRSLPKALKYFQSAADQGFAQAQYNLGVMYLEGKGVQRDFSKTFEWFLLAANQGHVDAQWELASIYYEGKGQRRNVAEAYAWWIVASSNGDVMSKENVKKAERLLTPSQKVKGRRRAKEIQARISG